MEQNIFILVTDKVSNIYRNLLTDKLFILENKITDVSEANREYHHIYITSDEEIEKNDWVIKNYETRYPESKANEVLQVNKIDGNNGYLPNGNYYNFSNYLTVVVYDRPFQGSSDHDISRNTFKNGFKKIVLTTDPELIDYGVQAIDDDLLKWLLDNSSCKHVELIKDVESTHWRFPFLPYKIPTSKEETLQDAAINHCKLIDDFSALENPIFSFKQGAKWQAERMYSEEEIKLMFNRYNEFISHHDIEEWQSWIDKQFKKNKIT